jgi:hypothetical protein
MPSEQDDIKLSFQGLIDINRMIMDLHEFILIIGQNIIMAGPISHAAENPRTFIQF